MMDLGESLTGQVRIFCIFFHKQFLTVALSLHLLSQAVPDSCLFLEELGLVEAAVISCQAPSLSFVHIRVRVQSGLGKLVHPAPVRAWLQPRLLEGTVEDSSTT